MTPNSAGLRILFVNGGNAASGGPLYPLAATAARLGHAVAFVTQAGSAEMQARLAGFLVVPSNDPATYLDMEAEWMHAVAAGGDGTNAWERALWLNARFFVDATLRACFAWQPQIIVTEETCFGAMIAAERYGIPHVEVPIFLSGAPGGDGTVPRALPALLARLRAAYDLPLDPTGEMFGRYALLQGWPHMLRSPEHPPSPTTFAYNPFDPPTPSEQKEDSEKPLVWLTLGTNASRVAAFFPRLIKALSPLPIRLVVTTAAVSPEACGPLPPNVRAERFIKQTELLPTCAAMVTVGGSGTVAGALAHGVPLVILPLGNDQPTNAANCERLGVAPHLGVAPRLADTAQVPRLVISLSQIAGLGPALNDPPLVGAVRAVLDQPRYREAAQRVQAAFAALPPRDDAIRLIEKLVAEYPGATTTTTTRAATSGEVAA